MNNARGVFKIIFYLKVLCILTFFSPMEALSFNFYGWERGAEGYDAAYSDAVRNDKPLIIYFRTNWCGWCKKLDNTYLASSEMKYLFNLVEKVAINPEKGQNEKTLAKEYGVRGYPTVLVGLPSFDDQVSRVSPFRGGSALSVTDFRKEIKKKISDHYTREGISHHQNMDYYDAAASYRRATDYNRKNVTALYNLGVAYEEMAHQQQYPHYLKRAKESYRKALEIDPGHVQCDAALDRLEQNERGVDPDGAPPQEADLENDPGEEEEGAGAGRLRYWVDENGVRHYSSY